MRKVTSIDGYLNPDKPLVVNDLRSETWQVLSLYKRDLGYEKPLVELLREASLQTRRNPIDKDAWTARATCELLDGDYRGFDSLDNLLKLEPEPEHQATIKRALELAKYHDDPEFMDLRAQYRF